MVFLVALMDAGLPDYVYVFVLTSLPSGHLQMICIVVVPFYVCL